MCAKIRKDARYDILGRVECKELSALQGTLLDISRNGCKLHFTVPVTVNTEDEYSLKVKFTDIEGYLCLIAKPMWVSETSGTTDIGMTLLHSPDTDRLNDLIRSLHLENSNINSIENQIIKQECQFL